MYIKTHTHTFYWLPDSDSLKVCPQKHSFPTGAQAKTEKKEHSNLSFTIPEAKRSPFMSVGQKAMLVELFVHDAAYCANRNFTDNGNW